MNKSLLTAVLLTCFCILSSVIEVPQMLSRAFSIFYVFYCFIHFFKLISSYKRLNSYFWVIVLFSFIYFIYTICSKPVPGELNSKWGMLSLVLQMQFSFFPFYYHALKGHMDEHTCLKIFKMLLGVCFLGYFLNYYKLLHNPLLESNDGYTNNWGYNFLSCLPFIFLLKGKISNLYSIVLFGLVLVSMKRGAIFILLFAYLFYVFLTNRKYILSLCVRLLLAISSCCIIFYFVYLAFLQNNLYFQKRLEQTLELDSSGRDDLIYSALRDVSHWDDFSLLFGKGINYSHKVLGNFAHQDWMELFLTMGILGVTLYFFYFLGLYSCVRRCRIAKMHNVLFIILVLLFLQTLFSMVYFDLTLMILNIQIAYILGREKYEYK